MILSNKRGSASVFLSMISITLIGLVLIFTQVAKATAINNAVNALGNLWAESVISEYDRQLQQRYGIFGHRNTADEADSMVRKMATYSFDGKRYIDNFDVDCELYEYSLSLPEVLKPQIIIAGQMKRLNKDELASLNTGESRYIENRAVLNALPSWESDVSKTAFDFTNIIKSIGTLDEIIKGGGERYFINNYINCYFKDCLTEKKLGDTYFKNEIEYIICGKTSDEQNESAIRNRIIGMREIMNISYLTTDVDKNNALTVAAELLTPGPQATLTKQALKASWALAESINDYKLLKNGKTVEFIKTDESWAIDLESIINNVESDCIDTGVAEGNDYADYLNFFTWMMSEELIMLRIMDLIQINMCYTYDADFLMKDCSGGVCLNMSVNSNKYEFRADYEG